MDEEQKPNQTKGRVWRRLVSAALGIGVTSQPTPLHTQEEKPAVIEQETKSPTLSDQPFIIRQNVVQESPPVESQVNPSDGPELLFNYPIPDNQTHLFKPYLTTRIGLTTEAEVAQLPNLKRTREVSPQRKRHYFSSLLEPRDNLIETEGGVVSFKRVITVTQEGKRWDHPLIGSYLERYGQESRRYDGSEFYGRDTKTLVYLQRGLALVYNPYSQEVLEIHVFSQELTPEEYLEKYGEDIRNYREPPAQI